MRVEKIEVKPFRKSLNPEFFVTVEYAYRSTSKIPMRMNGFLFVDDKRIGFLHEFEYNDNRNDSLTTVGAVQKDERSDRRVFLVPISQEALFVLEEKRLRDPKGDLRFEIILNFTFIETQFDQASIKTTAGIRNVVTPIVNSLLKIVSASHVTEIKISSGDWLQDFMPVFDGHQYHVFELALPKQLSNSSEFFKKLNAAINSLPEMRSAKDVGDWNGVIKESRPVWELIRNKNEIKNALKKNDIHETAISSFSSLIDALFDFASKFIHKESRNSELMLTNACKEDAELIYVLSVSMLNFISKKMAR